MKHEISNQIEALEALVVTYSIDLTGAIAILVVGWIVAG